MIKFLKIHWIFFLIVGCNISANRDLSNPLNLMCEYRTDPLGISDTIPRLSWEVNDQKRGALQSAYQVQVASSKEKLDNGEADIWDSGKVMSSQNIQVEYEGVSLQSTKRYHWRVKTWDADGNESPFSENAWWEMALLNEGDWKGIWIGDTKATPENDEDFYGEIPAPLFRKPFELEKAVKKACLYISGLGYYEASLNGEKIGDHVLDPGWTNYGERVLYSVFDVTGQLQEKENVIGVKLGNGWYNPLPLGLFRKFNLRKYLTIGQPKFIAQLHIEYEDGTEEQIVSNEDWTFADGPILKNNVYLGEVYDARLEKEGWDTPGYDAESWEKVEVKPAPGGYLTAQIAPPIRITKTLKPKTVTSPEPGVQVVDFGQNFAGWLRLKLDTEPGVEVKMLYGELLYDDGRVNGMTTVAGHIKEEWNLSGGPGAPKTAFQEDTYITKGGGEETYQHTFTFRAFRYVEIKGYPKELTVNDIVGLRLNADFEKAGTFESSNQLFNQIQEVTEWTFLSNVFSVQSDCPGREKFGYGGDIVTAAEAYMYNYHTPNFYTKTVRDFRDDARPNGGMPETAPYNGIDSKGLGEGSGPVGWQLAYPFVQDKLYEFYGDTRVITDHYAQTKKLVDFLRSVANEGTGLIEIGLSDHVSIDPKPEALTSACFYYHHLVLMERFAKILGNEKDREHYGSEALSVKELINERFLDLETGGYDTLATQITQTFALYYDLPEENIRPMVMDILEREIMETHKGHISTGIFGTKMIYDVLRENDRNDLAYTMVNQQEYPSYGYMLANGATTLWEHWDKSRNQNSKNHPMFGSVSEWFYRSILGINPDTSGIGFDKIILKPYMDPDMDWAKGSYQSVRGGISVHWEKNGNGYEVRFAIPANTTASVYLPYKGHGEISENGKTLLVSGASKEKQEGITFKESQNGYAHFNVGAGSYQFIFNEQ